MEKEKTKNPFASIIELTEEFGRLTDKSWRFEVAVQLAIAQQLSVISGCLKDINEALKIANDRSREAIR